MEKRARAAWLAERRSLITASDVAAILGEDPRRGPAAVWAQKVGEVEADEAAWMRRGRRLEVAIAEEYSEETGRPVHALDPYSIIRHPDLPWLGATLDRETEGCTANPALAAGRAPLELKAVGGGAVREWREEPPLHYQIQVQIQMACTGRQWGSLTALLSGLTLTWKDLARNDRFLAAALPRLEEFRLRVQRREPPEADGLPGTTAALKALYADEDGATVPLDYDALTLTDAWEGAGSQCRGFEAAREGFENKLRLRLGDATFGALPDGSFLSLKTTKRAGYTVEATSYRQLRRFRPRLKVRK
jgi:putative phage-type endonuclease